MDLIWWTVVIAGCVALAGCIALALWSPNRKRSEELRPLANTGRLTALPEYLRARRRHTMSYSVTLMLLLLSFAAATVTAARPSGLPSSNRHFRATQPEDIMVCIGAPVTDTAVRSTLAFFARTIGDFDTERIGLTSADRRIVPLTRDYQYAITQFSRYSVAAQHNADNRPFVSPVSYASYTQNADDLLALCMSGFPSFPAKSAQRRSLIYVTSPTCRNPETPTLFTPEQVRNMANNAGIQVNTVVTGPCDSGSSELAHSTGGRSYSADGDVSAHLRDIRSHPPRDTAVPGDIAGKPNETPDLPVLAGILTVTLLSVWAVTAPR